jgi:hypothetical protein
LVSVDLRRDAAEARGVPNRERHYLSEGSMAQLKPTRDTGDIAAIDSGE